MNCDIKIVCPDCLSALNKTRNFLLCQRCTRKYHLLEVIPSFTTLNPLFESRFIEHLKPSRFEKNWFYPMLEKLDISRRRIAFLKKWLKPINKRSLILDVGCGGGVWGLILKRYGSVVGMDVSMGSLKYARNIYEDVIHASITQIPFPSN